MTELSNTILEKYQIRKTKKQKTAFIEFLSRQIPELKVEAGGFGSNRNLVVGDVATAKTVLTAHYDTCAVMPVPNLIFPKNIPLSFLYGFAIAVPMLILIGILTYVFDLLVVSSIISPDLAFWLSELSLFLVVAAFFFIIYSGKPNRHTANDNTSGVILLCEVYAAMSDEQRQNTALVFFDNEEAGLLGSAYFRKLHRKEMQNKLLVNFDCISDGDHILLMPNRKAHDLYGEKITDSFNATEEKSISFIKSSRVFYPSDQSGFPIAVGVAAFKRSRIFGLYLDRIHTPRDTVTDERNIELLCDSTLHLIDTL
ncbi:MAG: M28 family peptidase [Oscillospiraceae bacterium]|nr:M28 family peptidase [Oscillospiraceae bacterium]